ncbi:MAG: glycerophosphodiester phosphodiesterase family protein, partial [Ignavibacteria bacterium]
ITRGNANYDITKTTFNQLRQINYFDFDFNQKFIIPTFDEIIKIIPEGKGIFIEIKDNRQKFLDILKSKLNSLNFSKSFIKIISYHPDILKYSKQIIPEIKTYWIFDSFFMRSECKNAVVFNRFYQTLKEIFCDGVILNLEANINENNVKRFHDLKLEICVYGVNDQNSTQRLIKSGVDYINTDYTKMVKAIILNYTKLNTQS